MTIGDADGSEDGGVGADPASPAGGSDDFDETPTVAAARDRAIALRDALAARDPLFEPVVKDRYSWESYKRECYDDADGNPPRDDDGEIVPFDPADALGFDPDRVENVLAAGGDRAEALAELVDERTVDVDPALDEDAFFSTPGGATTLANRYDLERAVPTEKKRHFREVERYWVNEPCAFVVLFHSRRENERKYYVIEPHLTPVEAELVEFLTDKLRTAIKYDDEGAVADDAGHRREVIESKTHDLLDRYDLYARPERDGAANAVADRFGLDGGGDGVGGRLLRALGYVPPADDGGGSLAGIAARPEPAVLEADAETLTAYQVEKLLYYLRRDFIGYERIDGIKHDVNVEDVSCDGYDSPVFVYHGDYEQVITNVYHGEAELDDFVVKLAQRSGKGISKRRPQVDATLPDGSRAQLTLGREVSDHGTNYTIRQFKDVPFTPIDLINWRTFSLDEMAFLWLCIENHKSLVFAGGTASGKTTSLNAVSLFIPSNAKIVSIEDTREVELPQRNWIASVTRPSFSDDEAGDVDEFDLLEAALRQRPDYIVMGEVRGEEGRTLFQVMSTGHTTYTTFHADNVGEVLKRFTTDPINVSKTMFTALDLVSIQTATRVRGRRVRRNKSLTEINHYDAENDEINVQDVYQWQAETDEFLRLGESNTLQEIKFDRGWSEERLRSELLRRRAVLAYLIDRGLNTYAEVAATAQAFINDPETILDLMAADELDRSLTDLREMESVLIDVDAGKEEMVPRPDPDDEQREEARRILDRAESELFASRRGGATGSVAEALAADADADDGGDAGNADADGDADREASADASGSRDAERPGDGEGRSPSGNRNSSSSGDVRQSEALTSQSERQSRSNDVAERSSASSQNPESSDDADEEDARDGADRSGAGV